MRSRWGYRVKQFFDTFFAAPTPADLELVRQTLTPGQTRLFTQLQPSEQAHAVRVLRAVRDSCRNQGFEAPGDLQAAALLHDIGKARYPLRILDRVMIVLGKAISPKLATRWGNNGKTSITPHGWVRPFIVAAQHPAWGAEMASQQGVSPLTVALIRRHQDPLPAQNSHPNRGTIEQMDEEDRLLAILQAVDDES